MKVLTDYDLEALRRKNAGFVNDVESRVRCGTIVALVEEVQRARAAAAPTQPDIKALVNRFLMWRLPQSVAADGCATNSSYAFPRSGTNLLNADEAEAMLRHVMGLDGKPS